MPKPADEDDIVLTDDELAQLRPASEVFPPAVVAAHRRMRGKQKAPTKILISLRVDPAVVTAYRDTGKGWQSRMARDLATAAPLAARRHEAIVAGPRNDRGGAVAKGLWGRGSKKSTARGRRKHR